MDQRLRVSKKISSLDIYELSVMGVGAANVNFPHTGPASTSRGTDYVPLGHFSFCGCSVAEFAE